ncbi:MAG: LuxR C-terminal-related transcriptional regulator [Ignavibacteriales bacterium]|nr:LuxR C-terminal-related transcriptional regulator [Ignavibacteriales bacterium]
MLTRKHVLIISPNQLLCLGLKTILEDFFSPESISIASIFENTTHHSTADYIFMPSDVYLAHHRYVQVIKSKIIIFTNYEVEEQLQEAPDMLNVTLTQEDLIDRLKTIFQKYSKDKNTAHQEELTLRETDVLKLVARGYINKQIADKLSISQHTVISHRKNITRKLGIKTLSGLTVYALLNGLVSSKEIE